jgi:uncharacterized protein
MDLHCVILLAAALIDVVPVIAMFGIGWVLGIPFRR